MKDLGLIIVMILMYIAGARWMDEIDDFIENGGIQKEDIE